MKYIEILNKMQAEIMALQNSLNELRCLDGTSVCDVYITRQEAAQMLGKGLRQLDRDCIKYHIERKRSNGGIRISKRDIMRHMGYSVDTPETNPAPKALEEMSEFERILYRHNVLKW